MEQAPILVRGSAFVFFGWGTGRAGRRSGGEAKVNVGNNVSRIPVRERSKENSEKRPGPGLYSIGKRDGRDEPSG